MIFMLVEVTPISPLVVPTVLVAELRLFIQLTVLKDAKIGPKRMKTTRLITS